MSNSWMWRTCAVTYAVMAGCFLCGVVLADDTGWTFAAEFVGFKDAQRTVAIFVMPDRSRIEVPVAALTEASRDRLPKSAEAATPAEGVTARGPLGQSITLAVPAELKAVETDAVWCHTAALGLQVYDLYLAGDSLTVAERSAAEKRRTVWADRAAEDRVRLGEAWVTPEEFEAAGSEARSMVQIALQSFKLEDAKRAGVELEKASRRNLEDSTADFVLGLAYWLQDGPSAKAIEHFGAAARRAPDDPYILNNVLVCEVQAGRYGSVVERFTRLLNLAPFSQPAADNLGLTIYAAGNRKPKMPERLVDRLLEIYRKACQDLKLAPIESATGRKYAMLSPEGRACRPGPLSTLPLLLESPKEWAVRARYGTAVAVNGNHFLANRSLVAGAAELFLQIPGESGGRFAATEVAWVDGCDVSLLRCEGALVRPMPVADRSGAPGDEVVALLTEEGILSPLKPVTALGRMVAAPDAAKAGQFFHSAVLPRGNGGGPIVDPHGRLRGLVATTPKTEQSGNVRGSGIPIDKIWPLLKEHLSDVGTSEATGAAQPWEAVATQAAQSTARVIAIEKRLKPK